MGRAGRWRAILASGLLTACALVNPTPGERFRDTLSAALDSRVCSPARIAATFQAFDAWADTVPASQREEIASVLLAQAEAFHSRGCDEAARVSLERVLVRFPSETQAQYRYEALRGLQSLPPPYPVDNRPSRGT